MTKEEAIERLKQIKKDNDEIVEESKNLATGELTASLANDSIAIETVLNLIKKQQKSIEIHTRLEYAYKNGYLDLKEELEKKDKIIDKFEKGVVALNQVHKYDQKMIDEVKGEAVKLYKIIDEMAKYIATTDSDLCAYLDMTTKCKNYAGENKKTCDNCIKEYFKRKVEDK